MTKQYCEKRSQKQTKKSTTNLNEKLHFFQTIVSILPETVFHQFRNVDILLLHSRHQLLHNCHNNRKPQSQVYHLLINDNTLL